MRPLVLLGLFLAGCGSVATGDGGTIPDAATRDSGEASDGGRDAGSQACGADVAPAEGVVVTSTGAVSGTKTGDVYRWLGIPYGRSPTGAMRWRAPEPVSCWTGIRAATTFGPSCAQLDEDGGVVGREDCLTVNVWAPSGSSAAPVMVWIHGGGNTVGSGSDPLFDGHELAARQGVVVVTLNYRLGALGFFTHASLNAESDAGVSGNYGILDQQGSLRWVRDNARAFGGDPARVLLFGESAGGQNTLIHLVSPGSKGLLSSAVVQSGGIYKNTLAQSVIDMQQVVQAAGCASQPDALECMRAASMQTVVSVPTAAGPLSRGLAYRPVIDGVVIPANVLELIKQGKHQHVPLAIGTNADETSRQVPRVTTTGEYEAAVRAQYGAVAANSVLVQYPASRFSTPQQALIAVTTDATYTCPARVIARAVAANQTEPVFRYFFTWKPPGIAGALIGSAHGLDVPFVFRSFGALAGSPPTAAQLGLSEAMQGYWSRLAASGNPNGAQAFGWPTFPVGGDAALELNSPLTALSSVRAADCDFIDSLAP